MTPIAALHTASLQLLMLPLASNEGRNERGSLSAFTAHAGAAARRPLDDAARGPGCVNALLLAGSNASGRLARVLGRDAYSRSMTEAKVQLRRYVEEVMLPNAYGPEQAPYLPTGADTPAVFHRAAAWQRVQGARNARAESSGRASSYNTLLLQVLKEAMPRYGKNLTPHEFRQQFAEAPSRADPDDAEHFARAIKAYCAGRDRPSTTRNVTGFASAPVTGRDGSLVREVGSQACDLAIDCCCGLFLDNDC